MKKLMSAAAVLALSGGVALASDAATETIAIGGGVSADCRVNAVNSNINVFNGLDQVGTIVKVQCNLPGEMELKIESDQGQKLYLNGASGPEDMDYKWWVRDGAISPDQVNVVGEDPHPFFKDYSHGDLLSEKILTIIFDLDDDGNEAPDENDGTAVFAGDYSDSITLTLGPKV